MSKPLTTRKGSQYEGTVPVLRDRALQACVVNALEPEWEARFEPRSYGFRPGRGCHDAIEAIYWTLNGRNAKRQWILDADLTAAFDRIDHDHLLDSVGTFPARELIRGWLKAGVVERGRFAPSEQGTPQGGVVTPPTQWITPPVVTLRVGRAVTWGLPGAGPLADGDAVPDGDLLGSDEDVVDQQPEQVLAVGDAGGVGVAQLGEEAFEVIGQPEVDLAVGDLSVQRLELPAQASLPGAQVRHPCPQLVDGDQLFLERLDHAGERGTGLGQGALQLFALTGDRIRGSGLLEPPIDLGPDQLRIGEQAHD